MNETRLKELKTLAGMFFDEVKSNKVTDLIVWIDCKYNQEEYINKEYINKVNKKLKR